MVILFVQVLKFLSLQLDFKNSAEDPVNVLLISMYFLNRLGRGACGEGHDGGWYLRPIPGEALGHQIGHKRSHHHPPCGSG